MNANHALVAFETMVQPLEEWSQIFEKIGYKSEEPPLSVLKDEIQKVKHVLRGAFSADFSQPESEIEKIKVVHPHLIEAINRLVDNYSLSKEILKKRENHLSSIDLESLDLFTNNLDLFTNKLKETY